MNGFVKISMDKILTNKIKLNERQNLEYFDELLLSHEAVSQLARLNVCLLHIFLLSNIFAMEIF